MLTGLHYRLLIRHLPGHPDALRPEYARSLHHAKGRLGEGLKRLEYLKPRIHARYENYVAQQKLREESRARRQASISQIPSATPYSTAAAQSLSSSSSRRSGVPKPLDFSRGSRGSISNGPFSPPLDRAQNSAGLNGSNRAALALEIAKQEFDRRETVKRQRRRQVAEEQGRGVPVDSRGREIRRISTPVNFNVDSGYQNKYPTAVDQYSDGGYSSTYRDHNNYQRRETETERILREQETEMERIRREREHEEEQSDLQRSIKALHMQSELTEQQMQPAPYVPRDSIRFSTASYDDWDQSFADKREREKHVGNWQYNYPTVPKRRTSPVPFPPMGPPPLPGPASSNITIRSVTPTPPPKPPTFYDGVPHSLPPALPTKVPPPSIKSTPDTSFQFTTPGTLENGIALRTIFLPSTLRSEFLAVAASNTRKNLETCGILCGTLIQNALFISRLVIPEQEATSDTCGTTDEEGLFTYCDSEDLMVLGWIHTHPTQTCFMSSVDLHTHCSYQLMLPESIAIVCAPRYEPS